MLKENLFKEWLKGTIELIEDFEETGILTSGEELGISIEDSNKYQITLIVKIKQKEEEIK